MHLLIDIREACHPQKTGKGIWTEQCVRALIARGVPMTLLTDAPLPEGFPRPPHVTVRRLRGRGIAWHVAAARLLLRSPDVTYVSPTSFIVPFLVGSRARTVIVVHDLIAFQSGSHNRKARWIERLTLGRAVRRAHAVCVLSEATRRDVLARFSDVKAARVTTVFAGPVHEGTATSPSATTILCPGTLCPRKNQFRLLQAYAGLSEELRKAHPLIFAGGRGWNDGDCIRLLADVPEAQWVGYVSDEAMDRLYADAAVVAVPSLYEGFGLPVLTAMRRGIPVLTSSRGSLAEVAGDAAVIVDPEDVDAIREGLQRLLTENMLRDDLRKRGTRQASVFSWERTATLLMKAMQ